MEVTCSHFSFLNCYRTEPDRITPVSFSWHYHDLQLRTRSVASRVFGSRHVETPATPAAGDIVWNEALSRHGPARPRGQDPGIGHGSGAVGPMPGPKRKEPCAADTDGVMERSTRDGRGMSEDRTVFLSSSGLRTGVLSRSGTVSRTSPAGESGEGYFFCESRNDTPGSPCRYGKRILRRHSSCLKSTR